MLHSVKSVCIRSYSGPYFRALALNTEKNTDQNNSESGHFLHSVWCVLVHFSDNLVGYGVYKSGGKGINLCHMT